MPFCMGLNLIYNAQHCKSSSMQRHGDCANFAHVQLSSTITASVSQLHILLPVLLCASLLALSHPSL